MKWTKHNKEVLKTLIIKFILSILLCEISFICMYYVVAGLDNCPIYIYQESLKNK